MKKVIAQLKYLVVSTNYVHSLPLSNRFQILPTGGRYSLNENLEQQTFQAQLTKLLCITKHKNSHKCSNSGTFIQQLLRITRSDGNVTFVSNYSKQNTVRTFSCVAAASARSL